MFKSPGLAALASFLYAGLGQVYTGNFLRGLAVFFGSIIGVVFFIIPGIIVWSYGIYDAYTTAKKMNERTIPFQPHNWLHVIAFIVITYVIMFIIFGILTALLTTLAEEGILTDLFDTGYY